MQFKNKSISTHGIIDTASDRTCVSNKFVNKHKLENELSTTYSNITGSNGEQFRTNGSLEANIIFKNKNQMKSKICVIKNLPVQVIIGLDCIARLGTIRLNARHGTISDSSGICLINKEPDGMENTRSKKSISSTVEEMNIPENVFKNTSMTEDEINKMKKLINEYRDIFCEKKKEAICGSYMASIPLKKELGEFIYTPAASIPLAYRERATKVIDGWLENGKIEPCQSSFNSRVLCVPKPMKEGQTEPDLRLCIDYRRLNSFLPSDPVITKKVSDLMLECPPHKYRSSFDLPEAYMQILIKPEDRHKTAFIFENKQYQFITLPFGLKVSGSSFIRVMNEVMDGLDPKEIRAYVDDILLTNESFEEHYENTKKFFERCRKMKIKLSTAKASIGQKEIKFLGIVLQEEGFSVNKKKIQAICDIDNISNIKELRSFIGMTSFWRRWIPNLSARSIHLTEALKTTGPIIYTEEMKKEVEDLKNCLTSPPVLGYVNLEEDRGDIILYTDANDDTSAWCLTQKHLKNGEWAEKAIGYGSKKFEPVETRYAIHKKEFLAVIIAVRQLRHLLLGLHFILRTDSITVKNYLQPKAAIPKELTDKAIIRMCTFMGDYDFEVEKISSKDNAVADGLTRLPKTKAINEEISTSDEEELILFQHEEKKKRKKEEINLSKIMKMAHDEVGHPGVTKSLKNFRNMVRINEDEERVRKWVETCEFCQFNIASKVKGVNGNISDRERPTYPFQRVAIDITHIKKSTSALGYKYALGVICEYSSYVKYVGLKTKTSKEVANKTRQYLQSIGLSTKQIHTDDGGEFGGEFKQLMEELGIQHTKATPYWKNKNAMIERSFLNLQIVLKGLMQANGKSWLANLEEANQIINATPQLETGVSAYQAAFGQKPRRFRYLMEDLSANEIDRRIQNKWQRKKIENVIPKLQLQEQDEVLVKRPSTSKGGYSTKYGQNYHGPFTITEKINPSTYLIENKNNRKIKANIRQLRKFRTRNDHDVTTIGVVNCGSSDYLGSSEDEIEEENVIKKNQSEKIKESELKTREDGTDHQKMMKFSGIVISSDEEDQPNQQGSDGRDQIGENNENLPVLESKKIAKEINQTKNDDEKTLNKNSDLMKNKGDTNQYEKDIQNKENGEVNNSAISVQISKESEENMQERTENSNTREVSHSTVAMSPDEPSIMNEEKESQGSEEKTIIKAEVMIDEEKMNDNNRKKDIIQNETITINDTNEYEESKFGSAHLELQGDQSSMNSQNETFDLSLMDNFHLINNENLAFSLNQLKTPEKSNLKSMRTVASTPILDRVVEKSLEEEEEESPTQEKDDSTKEAEQNTTKEAEKIEKEINPNQIPKRYKKYIHNDAPENQFLYFIPEKPSINQNKEGLSTKPNQMRSRRNQVSKSIIQVDRSNNQKEPRVSITKMSAKNIEDIAEAYEIELTKTLVEDMKTELKKKLAISHQTHPQYKGELKFRCFIAFRKPTTLRELNVIEQQTLAKQLDLPSSYIPEEELRRSRNPEEMKSIWLRKDNEQIDYSNTVNRSQLVTKLNYILGKRYPSLKTKKYSGIKGMEFFILDPKYNYGLQE